MKTLGIIFICLGFLLVALSAIFGLVVPIIQPQLQIVLVITGFPFLNLGIAFLFIKRNLERIKRPTLILFILSVVIIAMGAISKYHFHARGSNIEILIGSYLFCFSFVPLYSKLRYLKWSSYVESMVIAKVLTLVDMVSIISFALGILFKIMNWPKATLLLFAGIVFLVLNMIGWNRLFSKNLVLRKKAEDLLAIAHSELKEKNQEIVDSINYAKRIQSAILPSDKLFHELLPNAFVLYRPKDIVAGDFYWLEQKNGTVFFAAADCTGHGVPGAMVSVLCNGALNRSVREFGLTDPGKILDKTRALVIQEFEKSEEEVKDGMDIALIALERSLDSKSVHLKFAGAHNPLWIIRQGTEQIEEIKADKQPVGKFELATDFTSHTIELNAGDTFYIFSDGFADQFGGEKGKKFKSANFKKLLLSQQHLSMPEQQAKLEKAFMDWKGNFEQLDDLCIIGVKI